MVMADTTLGAKAIVVMGVSGCGKSTLGSRLAAAVGYRFIEGDLLHSAANLRKMSAAVALTDADRWAWLRDIGLGLSSALPGGAVAACSALRRSYRDRIRAACCEPTLFIFLDLDRESLIRRLSVRKNHFMPISLLDSQLQTLERPDVEEDVITIDGQLNPVEQLRSVIHQLQLRSNAAGR